MAAPLDKVNQPYHLRKYNEHERTLRTTLADQIGNIALHLKGSGVLRDFEYKDILTGVDTKPDECVSKLIEVLKKYEGGQFDQFMTCLTDLGYGNLVKEIRGNEEMEGYEEIDPSDFIQCDVDGVTGCDIDFVRDKFRLMFQGTKKVYPMRKEKRGVCLIINNYFKPEGTVQYRKGTEKDAKALDELFKELEFDVKIKEELSAPEIREELESCRGEINNSNDTPDCFILFILSHGKRGCIKGTNGEFVDITTIIDYFDFDNCPKLQGKPKLFFIQACQGTRREYKEVQTDTAASIEDYYLAIATSPGFTSYRHLERGAWFIQAIVATFKTYACKESFQKMMERIAQKMEDVGSNRQKFEMKQIKRTANQIRKRIVNVATPCYDDNLKHDLFFFPKSGTDLV